jgi:tRNA1Val (adenine37-N6)-methyltransferase
MKVCTDACLFGAYVAQEIQHKPLQNILDIGTGTGLLPLLLAQKTSAAIDAVEIDDTAYEQANQNIAHSPWAEQIKIIHTDITDFNTGKKYDGIISNPPFFEADLKSVSEQKNAAKHDTALTLDQLLMAIRHNLNEAGIFAVLLPYRRTAYFITAALALQLHCYKKVLVKQTPKHPYFRSILLFSEKESGTVTEEIIIKDEAGNYSEAFTLLLKDYYLYL